MEQDLGKETEMVMAQEPGLEMGKVQEPDLEMGLAEEASEDLQTLP
jgi:hypothetical protein